MKIWQFTKLQVVYQNLTLVWACVNTFAEKIMIMTFMHSLSIVCSCIPDEMWVWSWNWPSYEVNLQFTSLIRFHAFTITLSKWIGHLACSFLYNKLFPVTNTTFFQPSFSKWQLQCHCLQHVPQWQLGF